MKKYDLLLFGATRNTGLLIAKQAKAKNLSVAAMVHSTSEISALEELNVTVFKGDAFELDDCISVFKNTTPKLVVSVLGGKNSAGRRVDAYGNINVIQAANECASIKRFILMTSMGCGDQYEKTSEQVKKYLGEALIAKTKAENSLQKSTLPWTILRPGGLNNEAATGSYHLLDKPDQNYEGYISRADVAMAVMEILNDKKWLHKVITIQGNSKKKAI